MKDSTERIMSELQELCKPLIEHMRTKQMSIDTLVITKDCAKIVRDLVGIHHADPENQETIYHLSRKVNKK